VGRCAGDQRLELGVAVLVLGVPACRQERDRLVAGSAQAGVVPDDGRQDLRDENDLPAGHAAIIADFRSR
jgi:hypothetical protein